MITALMLATVCLALAAGTVIAWRAIHGRLRRREAQPRKACKGQERTEVMQPPLPTPEDQLPTGQEGALIAQETQSTGESVRREAEPTAVPQTTVPTTEEAGARAVQRAEQTEGEETQPRVVIEESREMPVGRKPELVEVRSATTPENPELPLVEEVQPEEVKKQLPTGIGRESPRSGEKGPKPVDRGGRPRGRTQPQGRRITRERASRRAKPEIVCWKRERQWSIGVEVAEDLLREVANLEVYQDGSPLLRDDSRESCFPLNSIFGQVTVQWNEGEPVSLTLGQDGYLLFKLGDENLSQGRLVKSASSGSYLVVAPDSWERDEIASGAPLVMPEPVALDEYSAHFFDLEKGNEAQIVFRTPKGDRVTVPLNSMRFELVGLRLEDISEGVGPLFCELPKIRVLDAEAWKEIKTIVIGEEGGGRGKWRITFDPDNEGLEQELPSEILNRKGGWFFLRFYDANDELIESTDFRFLCGLKQISVPRLSPLPSEQGHKPVRVQLFHEPGIIIQAIEDLPKIPIEREDSQTTLTIPPDYASDVTRWLVGYENGPQVEVTILVERLWWSLGEEAAEPAQWEDKPRALSPDDLAAVSRKALWLRFPKRRWVDSILVGFERPKARRYPVKVADKTLPIPLREFADVKEAMDRTQDQRLKVWIEHDGEEMEGVVAVIPAIPIPPPLQEWVGIGRYKTAVARAMLQHGSGNITVNGSPIVQYFKEAPLKSRRFLRHLQELPEASEALSQLDACVEVKGSSPSTMRQAKAVAHALARALMTYDPELKPLLKRGGFGGVKVRSMCWRD